MLAYAFMNRDVKFCMDSVASGSNVKKFGILLTSLIRK